MTMDGRLLCAAWNNTLGTMGGPRLQSCQVKKKTTRTRTRVSSELGAYSPDLSVVFVIAMPCQVGVDDDVHVGRSRTLAHWH